MTVRIDKVTHRDSTAVVIVIKGATRGRLDIDHGQITAVTFWNAAGKPDTDKVVVSCDYRAVCDGLSRRLRRSGFSDEHRAELRRKVRKELENHPVEGPVTMQTKYPVKEGSVVNLTLPRKPRVANNTPYRIAIPNYEVVSGDRRADITIAVPENVRGCLEDYEVVYMTNFDKDGQLSLIKIK